MRLFASYRHNLVRLLFAGVVLYVIAVASLVIGETHSVYRPFDGPTDPAAAGLKGFTRHTLTHGLDPAITYWENTAPKHAPTLLYFHGNGGGLFLYTKHLAWMSDHGLHVVAMDYPGYPGAAGSPSQALIVRDAVALYDHVALTDKHIAVWGYSLGSGPAVQLAAQRPVTALVLEAPFTAVVDRAAELFPYIPVHYLMRNTYLSREYIGHVKAPLFIMHGGADRVIPIAHGRALFARANEPKTLREYPDAGHFDLKKFGAYDDAIAFINAHR